MSKADNKELEEAIKILNELKEAQKNCIKVTQSSPFTELWEKQNKAIETVLNYIDNSISKEVIKEKIEELKSEYNRIVNQTGELIDNLIDFQRISSKIEVLQELLEGK